ncbi:hypothetical protein AUJ10_03865 [Candidatus Pacearchaeota archaeon CG1_02_31_27]|nr:MAG: hypothetical protein AUJ10_03865 [Candidatus Pacearchaeota archaeon CG1_02_31_27]
MPGVKLAALYGIYPHLLGFCGPLEKSETKIILDFLSGFNVPEKKIRKILKEFKGAYFYYKLIAKSNKIKNPFDEKVVRAYWIGNSLLEKVKIKDLKKMIANDFKAEKEIPETSKPHHSFHVLAIGSVSKRVNLKGEKLDLCRISWGKVIRKSKVKSQKSKVTVKYQPLIKNKKFKFGKAIQKEIFWDKIFTPKIKIGDWVSLHWNHLIQILNREDLKNLKKYTKLTLNSLNEK